MTRRASAALGVAVLAVGVLPGAAKADQSAAAVACTMQPGSVTAGGDHRGFTVSATTPVTATVDHTYPGIYADGQVKASSSFELQTDDGQGNSTAGGWVIIGSALYGSGYTIGGSGAGTPNLTKIMDGWANFTMVDTSYYVPPSGTGPNYRANQYGFRADGVIFRWKAKGGAWWTTKESYPGFSDVKTMVLISRTFTYDTFLANTKSGTLITIRIPTTSPMKPIVKRVRNSTWQTFEYLIAQKCGTQGTLLLGVDKDGKAGYLYSVGHANGLSTSIQGLGKVPLSFNDPVYFRYKIDGDSLFGE